MLHSWVPLLLSMCFMLAGCCAARHADEKAIQTIAFGSCSHQDHPQPIWAAVERSAPDLLVLLGDNIYADTLDMKKMRADYEKQIRVPGFEKLYRDTPIIATWDDHDFGANDAGAEYPRKAEAQELFLRYFGPKDKRDPRHQRQGVYHAAIFGPPGQRVQVIALDTRHFRSALVPKDPARPKLWRYLPNTDPAATILGPAQWQWLQEQLKAPAEIRIIASSIQVIAEDHEFEKWANIPHERQRLCQVLRDAGVGGVFVISGDRHRAEISCQNGPIGYPLWDITSSGFNRHSGAEYRNEPNRHRLGENFLDDNFGLIKIDWAGPSPLIHFEIRDTQGNLVLHQATSLSQLQPQEKR